jgi:hypothetical protein
MCRRDRAVCHSVAEHFDTVPYPVYRSVHSLLQSIQCVRGGGGNRVVWRASTGVIHCVFDQIPNLKNCFTTPNRNLGGEGASDR